LAGDTHGSDEVSVAIGQDDGLKATFIARRVEQSQLQATMARVERVVPDECRAFALRRRA
jgi:hypothetical protein